MLDLKITGSKQVNNAWKKDFNKPWKDLMNPWKTTIRSIEGYTSDGMPVIQETYIIGDKIISKTPSDEFVKQQLAQ